jgi:hypothetical protein
MAAFGQERSLAGEEKGRWKLAAQLPKNQKMYWPLYRRFAGKQG